MTAAPLAPASHGALSMIRPEVTYYQHQVDGIRELCSMGSALLADDMGLGKSIQALTVFAVDYEMGKAQRLLIVSPASLKWNWQEEIEKFTLFGCAVLDGSPKQRSRQLEAFDEDGNVQVMVVNYEQVVAHLDELNALGFDVVIYDEAHYIKGNKSKRTKAALKLKGRRHLLLTGSPILNHAPDLWSLMNRLAPGEFDNYYKFCHRYCLYGGFKGKEIVGIKNEAELREKVDVRMIRRRKTDVLTLPGKLPIVQVLVELHPDQRALYKEAVEELIVSLPDDPEPMDLENPLTKFMRLKQICGTTACIPGYEDVSSKLNKVIEDAVEVINNGDPVVIFTQFRDVLACINNRLTAEGVDWRTLHGDVPIRERVPVVTAWGEDAGRGMPQALVCMLQVAGVGLNMTAASTALFADKLTVPKLNEQAQDRLDRIGQTKPVQIREYIARNTIEEQRIETIIRRKTKVFNTLVEVESDWKQQLQDALMGAGT